MRNVRLEYPAGKKASQEQKRYIAARISEYWTLLKNHKAELLPRLELGSFADYFLLTELSKNVDAYWRSSWYFKDQDSRGGRIHAGPIWDVDLAFGQMWEWNSNQPAYMSPAGWQFLDDWRWFSWGHGHGGEVNEYKALLQHPEFKALVIARWQELRKHKWSDKALRALLTPYRRQILATSAGAHASAVSQEARRWPAHFRDGNEFLQAFSRLEAWLLARAAWMDQQIHTL